MKQILAMLLMSTTMSYAEGVSPEAESQIRKIMPKTNISQINPGPWNGTYEVIAGSNAFYVGSSESEIIIGHVLNINTMQDVTELHMNALNAKNYEFKSLPLKNALKVGTGSKKLAVFLDPDCPYCQQLEAYLATKHNKLTIYYFFMPLPMHPNALPHTKQILCSANPQKALSDVMIGKQELPVGSNECQAKVDKQLAEINQFTLEKGINSTPFIITDNNQVIGGFNVPQLQAFIDGGK